MDLTIAQIERVPISVPFRDVPERHMRRELPHWTYFEVVEVELSSGHVGHGETMLYYGWGETTDKDVERARGENPLSLMWDDSLGPGLQIACFDAVGRALDVPVYELLGGKANERTPISWWCIDMPPEDWVREAQRAIDAGYRNLKLKTRPWFDIRDQFSALSEALPEGVAVDIDFNSTLLDAERGLPLLRELEGSLPQLSHVEGPLSHDDVDGNARITSELDIPTVLHYGDLELVRGELDPITAIAESVCDGFVAHGGASHLRDVSAVTAVRDVPFWLQLVGTDITAAFTIQCGAAFEQAKWPSITCHQIYETELLTSSIQVQDGYVDVPDSPGLGYDIDMETVRSYEVEKPHDRPNPLRLIESDWEDGHTMYIAEGDVNFMIELANDGQMPYFERGVRTRIVPNDESEQWKRIHSEAKAEPVITDEPLFE